ncbi:MAG: ABC transporter permease [Stenotrophomonas sp.]
MHYLSQTFHLLALLLATHRSRPADVLLIGAGFAISAAALTFMLSIPAGMDRIAGRTGQDDIILALSSSAQDEVGSSLSPSQISLISTLPAIQRDRTGAPMVAPQFLATARLTRDDGSKTSALVRGVSPATWRLLGGTQTQGVRTPVAGSRQLLAGRSLMKQISSLQGESIEFRGSDWDLAGPLDSNGSLWESELWADISDLQAAYANSGRVSSLWLKLHSTGEFSALQKAVAADPRLDGIRLIAQTDYYRQQLGFISSYVTSATLGISILLGIGAVLAISTTLGMALEKQRRETATLMAIGFHRASICSSLLLDILFIGAITTAATVLMVYLGLDGRSFGTSSANHAVYAHFVVDLAVAIPVAGYNFALCMLSSAGPLRAIAISPPSRQLTA